MFMRRGANTIFQRIPVIEAYAMFLRPRVTNLEAFPAEYARQARQIPTITGSPVVSRTLFPRVSKRMKFA
jgi:hypothetical protein